VKIAMTYLLILIALSCSGFACMKAGNAESTGPVGDYAYTGFDKDGNKIVEGRLSITSATPRRIGNEESTELKGTWELKEIGHHDRIGGQVGSGDLIGSIGTEGIYIDLNPNMNDANVILRGSIDGKRFHGKWSANGIAGPINQGTFEATRK